MIQSMGTERKTTHENFRGVFFLLFLLLSFASGGQAQQEQAQGVLPEGRGANYRFAEQGELTITVCLLGAVRLPGRYEISRSIDLLNLLALAGGWMDLADLGDVRINRFTGAGDQNTRRNFVLDLTEFQEIERTYLTLQQGDFIYIGTESGITVQEVLTYITTAAILVTTYFTISNQISQTR